MFSAIKRFSFYPLLASLFGILLFSALLSIAFLEQSKFFFTWFAFVPLLLVIRNVSLVRVYWLSTLAGFVAFASGMYWILDFIEIVKGNQESVNLWMAIGYWLYCSQQIALAMLLFEWLRRNAKIHELFIFPIVMVLFTSSFPMLFSMRLAETQISLPYMLQGTSLLGVYALDGIVALINIMILQAWLSCQKNLSVNNELKGDFTADGVSLTRKATNRKAWYWAGSILAAWLLYGYLSFNNWKGEIEQWQQVKVGMVQPNEKPKLTPKKPNLGYSQSFPAEMEMTKRLASIGAEIVVWPEASPKNYFSNSHIRSAFQAELKKLGVSLIFQDINSQYNLANGRLEKRFNAAIHINGKGQQTVYNKIKRIPIGEYLPLLDKNAWLSIWLEEWLGGFLNHYDAGESFTRFEHQQIRLIPLICYETTFSQFVANAVAQSTQSAKSTKSKILIAMSNDGWFGSTHQPFQHIMGSVLRAVENRLPLVHVANNGPSIVVSPTGEIVFTSDFLKAGGYLVDVAYSSDAPMSFYSRYPWLFISCIYLIVLMMLIRTLRVLSVARSGLPK